MPADGFENVAAARALLERGEPLPPEFPPLVELASGATLPSLPIETLTPWMADYAREVAASTRFSVDMAAGFALGAASAAIGACVEVMPNADWREPVSLYLAIVAEPSEGKSPVFKRMMAPIFELDAQLARDHGPRFAQDMADRKVEEGRLAKMKGDLERKHDANLRDEYRELAATLSEPVKAIPRLAVQDVTAETLAMRMMEQNERLAILSPEDTLWAHVGGRYSDSPSVELYLSAYTGEEVRVDRATRTVVLRRPALTICVAMQPAVLMGKGSRLADERGLLARFLYVAPPRVVGTRDHSTDPPAISEVVRTQYHDNLTTIAQVNRVACRERQQLRLDPSARVAWRAWQQRLEVRRREDGDLFPIRGWAGKAEGSALRLAGLLAMTDGTMVVSAAVMERAFTLVEYFVAHAKSALGLTTATDDTRIAARILAWLERTTPDASGDTPLRFVTHREAWKANKSWLTSHTAREGLERLCDHGYLLHSKRGKAVGYLVRPRASWTN